jgi:succinate dehydrogenase / fumarate reductase flavoprotein subunit
MHARVGIFRNEKDLTTELSEIRSLRDRFKKVRVSDRSVQCNTELIEALEVGHLLDFSILIAEGGLARKECRGAHWRIDHPGRNDKDWMKHTFAWLDDKGEVRLAYRPVTIIHHQPEERKY